MYQWLKANTGGDWWGRKKRGRETETERERERDRQTKKDRERETEDREVNLRIIDSFFFFIANT